ncbi:MAG TPA: CoA transferase [Victivallales bacterium]|nr:CoA transferase [Victivallales bacterium]
MKNKHLDNLLSLLGINEYFNGNFKIIGSDPIIQSPHKLGEAASIALLSHAAAVAAVWNCKTGINQDINIDIHDALHSLHTVHFIWTNGYKRSVKLYTEPTTGFYKCKDGRWIHLCSGPPYPKLKDGILNFFNCNNYYESVAKAVAKWNSYELEDALSCKNMLGAVARTKEEWGNHPQGKYLSNVPVVEITKINDGPKIPFTNGKHPLSGIKTVDFTHVLAGPRSTMGLAEYGADVVHVSSPSYLDPDIVNLTVNQGKKNAFIDFNQQSDIERFLNFSAEADIFAQSWRSTVVEKFGLTPETLAKNSKSGIIYMSANCYGHGGPWQNRGGFEHIGQTATGISVNEGSIDNPKLVPTYYLCDLLTGYLASAGMIAALLKRAKEGGSYHVKVSLARSAMWTQELGLIKNRKLLRNLPINDSNPKDLKLNEYDTVYGKLLCPAPAAKLSKLKSKIQIGPRPYGADLLKWET